MSMRRRKPTHTVGAVEILDSQGTNQPQSYQSMSPESHRYARRKPLNRQNDSSELVSSDASTESIHRKHQSARASRRPEVDQKSIGRRGSREIVTRRLRRDEEDTSHRDDRRVEATWYNTPSRESHVSYRHERSRQDVNEPTRQKRHHDVPSRESHESFRRERERQEIVEPTRHKHHHPTGTRRKHRQHDYDSDGAFPASERIGRRRGYDEEDEEDDVQSVYRRRPLPSRQPLQPSSSPLERNETQHTNNHRPPRRRTQPTPAAGSCEDKHYCATCAHLHEVRLERRRHVLAKQTPPSQLRKGDLQPARTQRISRRIPRQMEEEQEAREYRHGRSVEGAIRRQHANPLGSAPCFGVLKNGKLKKPIFGGDTVRFASEVERRYTNEFGHEPVDNVWMATPAVDDEEQSRKGGQTRDSGDVESDVEPPSTPPFAGESAGEGTSISSQYLKGLTTYIFLVGSFIWLWYLMPRTPPPNHFPYYYDQRYL